MEWKVLTHAIVWMAMNASSRNSVKMGSLCFISLYEIYLPSSKLGGDNYSMSAPKAKRPTNYKRQMAGGNSPFADDARSPEE